MFLKISKCTIKKHLSLVIPAFGIILLLMISACEKDTIYRSAFNFPTTFHFQKSEFKGDIRCYDSTGNQVANNFPELIPNDFLFHDGYKIPYKTIQILADSSVEYSYIKQELLREDSGYVSVRNDSLCFYLAKYQNEMFKGQVNGQYMRIPCYGIVYINLATYHEGYGGSCSFGIPVLNDIINNLHVKDSDYFLIQEYDWIYKTSN